MSVNDLVKDEAITKLRTQYMDAASQYAQLSAKLGSAHPSLVNLRAEMDQIRASLPGQLARVRLTLKGDHDLAQERVKEIQKEVSDAVAQSRTANLAQAKLRQLEISAQTYQSLYDTFLHRYTDALQQQKSAIAAASIITPATPPAVRNYKKTLLVSAIFPLLGLGLGGGIGFLREFVNRVFWTGRAVQSSLRLPCISIIPKIDVRKVYGKRSRRRADQLASQETSVRAMVRGDRDLGWYAIDTPLSRYAEALRAIKLAVDVAAGKRGNVIGFTSALPNEGKSTVALGFALLAARGGAKVILVDCDLRNPSLTAGVTPANANGGLGLLDVLGGRATVGDVVFTDSVSRLDFLPAAHEGVQSNSSDVLAGAAIVKLFEELRADYDLVVADVSPLAPIVDASITANFIDKYILVIEWGQTKVETVIHTLRVASEVYENTLGAVLNKADIRRLARYDSHLSGYYHTKYDSRYGLSKS
jgi:polysaccharide biosynthesis transport protein